MSRVSLTGLCVPMRLELSRIPPDRYQGPIRFQFSGATDAVSQTLNLAVRSGPVLPLTLILLGVLIGRVAAFYESTGSKIRRLLAGHERLESWYKSLGHSTQARISKFGTHWLPALHRDIADKKIAEADAKLVKLKLRRDLIERIFDLEKLTEAWQGEYEDPTGILGTVLNDLKGALHLLVTEQDDQAADAANDAVNKLDSFDRVPKGSPNAAPTPAVEAEIGVMEAAASSAGSLRVEAKKRRWPPDTAWYRVLRWSEDLRSDDLALLSGALFFVLLLGVSAAGFVEIYLANETFGARPLADLAYAFFWGFLSNVVAKKLSDLASGFKPST